MRRVFVWLFFITLEAAVEGVSVQNLRTEYLENPLGIDRAQPRLSWELTGDAGERAVAQVSYRVQVRGDAAADVFWDSGSIKSSRSFQVKYDGPALASFTLYHWSVIVVSTIGESLSTTISSSTTAHFSMGALRRGDWGGASFIGMPATSNATDQNACPWFRKTFDLPLNATTTTALLSVGSVGFHELSVNGMAATEAVLLPSVSYIPKRVLYRTYNVSALLKPGGRNTIGIWASAGWAQYLDMNHGIAELAPMVLARLDAGPVSVVTDASWKVHESTTRHYGGAWGSGGFGGDSLDDTKDIVGWDRPEIDDSAWDVAATHPLSSYTKTEISADTMEPTIRHGIVLASGVSPAATSGSWTVEMAELFTGWFEVQTHERGAF